MPANQAADFFLNGKPFMLWRDPRGRGRAWQKQRVPDSLADSRRLYRSIAQDEIYGGLPNELDHPEIWSDWSGGFGRYRGRSEEANHFHVGFNVDTRFPGQTMLAQKPQGFVHGSVIFLLDVPLRGVANPPDGAGTVLAMHLSAVNAYTPSSATTFDEFDEFSLSGFPYGRRAALAGSFVYIPNLSGSGFTQRSLDGTSLTTTVIPASAFAVAASRLWKASGSSLQSVPVTSDPTQTANWSASIPVGNGFLRINDLYAFEDNVFVGMPDGLYVGNQTGTFNNVATEIGAAVDIDNVRDLTAYNGGVVFGAGTSIWWFKPSSGANSTLRQIWPNIDIKPFASLWASDMVDSGSTLPVNGLSMYGHCTAVLGYGQWLYAGIFTGSASFIFAGTDASGAGPYVWHPMQALPGAKVTQLHIDQLTTTSGGVPIPQRMWAATDISFGTNPGCTNGTYFWPIPRGNGSPLADPSFSPNYCSAGYIEQSLTDSEAPGVWKLWRKMEAWTEHLGANAPQLAVQALLDATMVSSFDSTSYTQVPKDWHYFKNTNNDAIANSASIAMKLQGSGSSTPLVRALVGHNAFRPRIAEIIAAKVRIADGIQDRQQNEMRPGAVMLDDLETMSKASNPVPLVDLVGRTYPVVVLPGVDEQEEYQVGSDYPEVVATAKIGVIDASWNAAPATPFHPDGG